MVESEHTLSESVILVTTCGVILEIYEPEAGGVASW